VGPDGRGLLRRVGTLEPVHRAIVGLDLGQQALDLGAGSELGGLFLEDGPSLGGVASMGIRSLSSKFTP
jgi:hypothetical protein